MQTGKVVSVIRSGATATVVLHGLGGVAGGQRLRRGRQVWIVDRRVWRSGDDLCVILQAVSGGLPQIGDRVSLVGVVRPSVEREPVADPEPESLRVEIDLEPAPEYQVAYFPSVTSEEVLEVSMEAALDLPVEDPSPEPPADEASACAKPAKKRKAKRPPPKPRRSGTD